jgi:hypothetical protein
MEMTPVADPSCRWLVVPAGTAAKTSVLVGVPPLGVPPAGTLRARMAPGPPVLAGEPLQQEMAAERLLMAGSPRAGRAARPRVLAGEALPGGMAAERLLMAESPLAGRAAGPPVAGAVAWVQGLPETARTDR